MPVLVLPKLFVHRSARQSLVYRDVSAGNPAIPILLRVGEVVPRGLRDYHVKII